ncbi:MAG: hypothetical protein FJ303_22935 [Planctomycetes bacterium]|nr:hypothetical protein [Planctomycetota bacterium]
MLPLCIVANHYLPVESALAGGFEEKDVDALPFDIECSFGVGVGRFAVHLAGSFDQKISVFVPGAELVDLRVGCINRFLLEKPGFVAHFAQRRAWQKQQAEEGGKEPRPVYGFQHVYSP